MQALKTFFIATSLIFSSVAAAAPLPVTASFSILSSLVEEIGGPDVSVNAMMGAGIDPHGFQPRPSDVVGLKGSKIFFVSGLGLDAWAKPLWMASKSTGQFVDVSQRVNPIVHAQSEHRDHAHQHNQDPHYWHDPARVLIVIDTVTSALVEELPQSKAAIEKRAASLKEKIQQIAAETKTELGKLGLSKKVALTPHKSFDYLGEAFGIHFVSPLGLSTAQDISATRLAAIQKMLEKREIQVAFFESRRPSAALSNLLAKHKIPTAELFADALSQPKEGAGTYLQFLEQNTRRVVQAFKLAAQAQGVK